MRCCIARRRPDSVDRRRGAGTTASRSVRRGADGPTGDQAAGSSSRRTVLTTPRDTVAVAARRRPWSHTPTLASASMLRSHWESSRTVLTVRLSPRRVASDRHRTQEAGATTGRLDGHRACADRQRVAARRRERRDALVVERPAVRAGVGDPLPHSAQGRSPSTTTGRRSGLPRAVPVLATRVGDSLTVSTVRNDSQWLRNIETDRNVAVWLFGHRGCSATATVSARGAQHRSPRTSPHRLADCRSIRQPPRDRPARSHCRTRRRSAESGRYRPMQHGTAGRGT